MLATTLKFQVRMVRSPVTRSDDDVAGKYKVYELLITGTESSRS